MPLVYWTMAPGAGQAMRQPGSCAVHALVLAHQPVQPALVLVFPELDQVPEVLRQIRQRLIRAHLHRGLWRKVVPLLAGDFAGLAPDARGRVDELRDRRQQADARRGRAVDADTRRSSSVAAITLSPV